MKPNKKRKASGTNPIYPYGFSGPASGAERASAGAGYPTFGAARSGGEMGGQGTNELSDTQLKGMGLQKKSKKAKATKKKSSKKKKMSMPTFGNGSKSFGSAKPTNAIKSVLRMMPKAPMANMDRIGTPQPGGTTQALMDSAQNNSKVLFKKGKKSKEKKNKMKGTKNKVSHVLQESSMCKACKTSHKPGKHSVKKKS